MQNCPFNNGRLPRETLAGMEQPQTEINNRFIFNYQERDVHRNNLRTFSNNATFSVIRGMQNQRRQPTMHRNNGQTLHIRQAPPRFSVPSIEEHKTPMIQISPPSIPSSSTGSPPLLNIISEESRPIPPLQESTLPSLNENSKTSESSAEDLQYEFTPPRTPRPPTSSSESSGTDLDLTPPTIPAIPPLAAPRMLLPSSFSIRQTDTGAYTAHIECTPDIALELISRNYDTLIQNSMELTNVFYDGTGFIVESPFEGVVLLAALQLRLRLMMFSVMNVELVRANSEAEDLIDVEFKQELEHKGAPICSICLCEVMTGDLVRRTPCLHVFHSECIREWLKTRRVCPIDKYFLN